MKKTHIISIVIFLSFIFCHNNYAQQDAQYTQYMYNAISVNPAYAGSSGVTNITALHRSQWLGLDGAPRTQTLTINTPVGITNRIGLGLSVINDAIGPMDETYIDIDFSYTIPASERGKLSFGLKAGGHLLNVDFQQLNAFDINDPSLENNINNKFNPNIGVGFYYHTDTFYVGLSAPNILATKHFDESAAGGSTSVIAKERINYYLMVGHVFDINEDVKFKPALLTKLVSGSPLQVDVSANFLFYERFTLGAAYRWSAALSVLAGFQLSDTIMVGFAYDRETTMLGKTAFNDGSYEVILSFDLLKKYSKITEPRFF